MDENLIAMLEAANRGDLETVRELLNEHPELAGQEGPPPRWAGCTPLLMAAAGGHTEVAKLLLQHGAELNPMSPEGSALLLAAYSDHLPTVQWMLENGADPNLATLSGETPLMAAAMKGYTEIGAALIDSGADINAQTTTGHTNLFNTGPPVCGESALHLAAAYGHREFVELLLNSGADKGVKDHGGQTPRNWAGRYLKNELIPLL